MTEKQKAQQTTRYARPVAFSASWIKDIAPLRGKKMAVTRFGGTMEFAARHFLETHGFEPDKDIVLIQVGSSADVVPALEEAALTSIKPKTPIRRISSTRGRCARLRAPGFVDQLYRK